MYQSYQTFDNIYNPNYPSLNEKDITAIRAKYLCTLCYKENVPYDNVYCVNAIHGVSKNCVCRSCGNAQSGPGRIDLDADIGDEQVIHTLPLNARPDGGITSILDNKFTVVATVLYVEETDDSTDYSIECAFDGVFPEYLHSGNVIKTSDLSDISHFWRQRERLWQTQIV